MRNYYQQEITSPEPKSEGNSSWYLPMAIIFVGIVIAGALYYRYSSGTPSQETQQAGLVPVGGRDAILGDPNAPVTLIEYADYQCPFCGRFFRTIEPKLRDEYLKTGKVRMVYRDFSVLGAESDAAANAAQCANDQGKFWPYHDGLYVAETEDGKENNGNLNRDLFLMLAQKVGLGMTSFTTCLDDKKYVERIKKESKDGITMGLLGTPTVYINGKQVAGLQPYSVYKTLIDLNLQK